MRRLIACLLTSVALCGTAVAEIVLHLDVVTLNNERDDTSARLISERIEQNDDSSKWVLQIDPARHWEEITVELDRQLVDGSRSQAHYHLTYGKLRELKGSELRFVAVVSGRQFSNPVVDAFLASLTPEPRDSDSAMLMRVHGAAMWLWRARHNVRVRLSAPLYTQDVKLAYWALRSARGLAFGAPPRPGPGFVLTNEVSDLLAWTQEMLHDPDKDAFFGSRTVPKNEFQDLINQLGRRDRIILEQATYAIEEDINRNYLPEEQRRGCSAAPKMWTYLEGMSPSHRNETDPNGTFFLRAASNTALCWARILNRRPIVDDPSLDRLLRDADEIVKRINAMLGHDDFKNAAATSRDNARSEAANLKNAVADFQTELVHQQDGEGAASLLH